MKNFKADVQTTAFLFSLLNEAEILGVDRINSALILKKLVELENSELFNAIFKHMGH